MILTPKAPNSYHKTVKPKLCMNTVECIDTFQYHIAGYTIPKFNKEKNGDDFKITYLKEERLIVGVVSDGVSQQPCDWLASALTCKGFIQYFTEADTSLSIEERIQSSIRQANQQLLQTAAPCTRLAATVSVCVIDERENQAFWCNIGDSRIFAVQSTSIQTLTKDDVRTIQQNIQTSVGKRNIERVQLTQCMGKSVIQAVVQTKILEKGEVLILASDGFYEARKASFHNKLIDFQRNSNFEKAFGTMASSFEIMRDDDMTVVAIQRKSL